MLGWWNEPKIEILKKERTFSLKPDLFISWQSKTINSAYVEIDLSTENYDTLFKKVENYNLAFETRAYLNENSYKHHKGVIPKVMFVFDNEQRLLKFNDGIKPSENGPKYTLITFDKISQIKKS
ncbi:hypothetical protein D3C81_1334630 [compost metagenome]